MKQHELNNWNSFKAEIAEEKLNLEELKSDLKNTGIDIKAFVADVKETVRQSYREASKKLAEEGIAEKKALLDKVYESIACLNRSQLFQKVKDLAEKGHNEALVFCREKTEEDISDDDLRYLLADFIINEGEGDVNK